MVIKEEGKEESKKTCTSTLLKEMPKKEDPLNPHKSILLSVDKSNQLIDQ